MMSIKVDPNWWKHMFDEVYLLTDARSVCDDQITRLEVDMISTLLPMRPEHAILDLCGGHGRHSLELCSRGFFDITVLDYSEYLLNHGQTQAQKCHYPIKFVRRDARYTDLPPDEFDHVLVLGNSLGYQGEPIADTQILLEARRVLKSGGWLLLDVTDGASVRAKFKPTSRHQINGDLTVTRERELSLDAVLAREKVLHRQDGVIRDQTYSIRIYEPETLTGLVETAGFKNVTALTQFSPQKTPGDYGFMNHRMIVTAQKL